MDMRTSQLEQASRLVGFASGVRYRSRGDFVFKGIPLAGAHVLEVGCGTGIWAIWAALHGAERVVGIEPEAEGSTSSTLAKFRQAIDALNLGDRVEASGCFLQELPRPERLYDVVIMYNVINHLNEEAVVTLHREPQSVKGYVAILRDLRSKMPVGGWVVVADSSRDNFWRRIGLRSPVASAIEWHKHQHQHPKTWVEVFKRAGFRKFDVRWSPVQPFPKLTANWLAQYLTSSHFVLRLQAV